MCLYGRLRRSREAIALPEAGRGYPTSSAQVSSMAKLFENTSSRHSLRRAWHTIRANGLRSVQQETRDAVSDFDRGAEANIARIQRALRGGTFAFAPQKGVLKKKQSGGKRGIVMAPIHNRIVERAWLNSLQEDVSFVRQIIQTPSSVGGVPDRSVPHGLALIRDAMDSNKCFFVRSDIFGFFDNIPRHEVLKILSHHIDDERFLKVLEAASEVTLSNEEALGEDRKLFPTNEDGVAQGSPLSALFGNVLLYEFDKKFNDRGIVCVRFIDDFVMLSESDRALRKAFMNAKGYLKGLGLECHDPFEANSSPDKAKYGRSDDGFTFLGYDLRPGLFQPSRAARTKFLHTLDAHIARGRDAVSDVLARQHSFAHRQRYAQTLDLLDRVVRGWGNSFAYANAPSTIKDLDEKIERKIANFRSWYREKLKEADWQAKRRTGGVCLLADVETKRLEDLPFRLDQAKRYRITNGMVVVSTDGSVIGIGHRAGRDRGPGGWAAVFHGDDTEFSGNDANVTINEMELTAVIEALKRTQPGSRVRVRTDSQYVYRAVQENTVIRSNGALWNEYKCLAAERRVDIVWVPGHNGDEWNERADALSREQSKQACRL